MNWIDRPYTEADVTAELVHQLKLRGEKVRCEVKLPSTAHRSGYMRCDVIVIRGNKIAFAIEVKDRAPAKSLFARGPHKPKNRQIRAYSEIEAELGIPVLWVIGMEGIEKVINCIAGQKEAA